jgi:hemolysin activation/secretion protein
MYFKKNRYFYQLVIFLALNFVSICFTAAQAIATVNGENDHPRQRREPILIADTKDTQPTIKEPISVPDLNDNKSPSDIFKIEQNPQDKETSPLLPPPEDLLPNTPTIQEDSKDSQVETMAIQGFDFVGNTVFEDRQLAEITKDYVGRPITFSQLLEARSAVTKLYVDAGYITSGAYIPPQELTNGIVRMEIIEGSLEAIEVRGKGRLNSEYVRDRLKLATEGALNVPRLIEALQLLQLNPLIEKISAELSAGPRAGLSLLEVEFEEAKALDFQITLDNGRSPSVGSFRRKFELTHNDLLGLGDGLSFAYTNTDGSDVFDIGYLLPINPRNGTLKLFYSTRSSGIIEPPFNDLDGDGGQPDIKSESRSYEITLRQPLYQTPNQEFAIGLTFDHWQGETSLLNIPFPLSAGADDLGRTRISSWRFFQEWTDRDEDRVIAARSQFSFGVDFLGATINNNTPDGRYFSWRGQAQWVKLLAPNTLFLIRTDLQIADRPLLAQEQFGLGGLDSIRGYRQDSLLTDNGILASMELRLPILTNRKKDMVLQIIPFLDLGTAWNNGNVREPDPNTLASLGIGLQWQQKDLFTARLDWGIPLISVDSRDRTLQEQGIYFSLIYNLF